MSSWARKYWPEVTWALFAIVNFSALVLLHQFETVPFHYVWVSMTLLYGFRVWRMSRTLMTLGFVCLVSLGTLAYAADRKYVHWDELTEVPLMAAMFLAMVWHARRRQRALDEVRRSAERERDFVRDASHELKTPIAVARALTQLMLEPDSRESLSADAAELDAELGRISLVAERLLMLATAEQDFQATATTVELEDVVISAARRWSVTAERQWRVDGEAEDWVGVDRSRLEAAVDALIENAIAATGDGDSITLRTRSLGAFAVLEVADTGSGIEPDFLPRVFERFVSSGNGSGRRGTGLGLPIVKAIVEAHGGAVEIQSTLGVGTTVTIRLPEVAAPSSNGASNGRMVSVSG